MPTIAGVILAPASAMVAAGAVFGASVPVILVPFVVGLSVFVDDEDDEDDEDDDDSDYQGDKEYSV